MHPLSWGALVIFFYFSLAFFLLLFYIVFGGNFASFSVGCFMKLFFAIFDKKSGLYDFVQSFKSEADAVRACRSIVNSGKESLLAQYPSDYELYRVAGFNQEVGNFSGDFPVFICGLGVLVDAPKEAANVHA